MKKTFKQILGAIITLTMLVVFTLALLSTNVPTRAAAAKKDLITSADLDHAYISGSTVFYQLTDEQGGTGFEFQKGYPYRKVPAVITFNYFDRRDSQGRRVWSLHVLRPQFLGGPFDIDEVASDSSRTPGTFDTVQPGDLVN